MATSKSFFSAADKINILINTFPSWIGGKNNSIWQSFISFADIFINLTDKETISQYKFLKAGDFIFTESPNNTNLKYEACRFNCLNIHCALSFYISCLKAEKKKPITSHSLVKVDFQKDILRFQKEDAEM